MIVVARLFSEEATGSWKIQRGLYIFPHTATLDYASSSPASSNTRITSICNKNVLIRHTRLGHLHLLKLKILSICNIDSLSTQSILAFDVCAKARQMTI